MVTIELTDEEAMVLRQLMDFVGGNTVYSYRVCTSTICDKLFEAGAKYYSDDPIAFQGSVFAQYRTDFAALKRHKLTEPKGAV